MLYREAIEFISNIGRSGSDYGIERMRELLELLDNPDRKLKFVHIAGTNGKGSVSAYITSVLKESGYKVGTYNSPSVLDYNERWLVNGAPASDDCVAEYMSIVRNVIEKEQALRKDVSLFSPTAFEIETAMAFLMFADISCDICVLETGLGGRWDATNVIREKELAVITPIGLDHCALLGDTLGEIASEKAAIIHDSVVTCRQSDEIMTEIESPYDIANGIKKYRHPKVNICERAVNLSRSIEGQTFEYAKNVYTIHMLGRHQITNASIAICAVDELRNKHWQISDQALRRGLESTVWHSRFEIVKNAEATFNIVIPEGKTLVFDGSHNPHGAKTLVQSISDYFPDKSIHLVLGMLKDKDVKGVVDTLAPYAHRITCITPPSPRALEKEELIKIVSKHKVVSYVGDSIETAVNNALEGDCETVILCGSLTLFAPLVKTRREM